MESVPLPFGTRADGPTQPPTSHSFSPAEARQAAPDNRSGPLPCRAATRQFNEKLGTSLPAGRRGTG